MAKKGHVQAEIPLPANGREAFVRCNLQQGDRDILDEVIARYDSASLLEEVQESCAGGLDFKLRRYQESWCAMFLNQTLQDAGSPFILTGWADSGFNAVVVLLYKHNRILGCDWNGGKPAEAEKYR